MGQSTHLRSHVIITLWQQFNTGGQWQQELLQQNLEGGIPLILVLYEILAIFFPLPSKQYSVLLSDQSSQEKLILRPIILRLSASFSR